MSKQLETQLKRAAAQALPFMPVRNGLLQRKCACGGTAALTGECLQCSKDSQGRAAYEAEHSAAPSLVNSVLRSSGQPLDAATRAFMEPRFGHDFSQVRVHTDARAAESARAVDALAYTVGRDIVFRGGPSILSTSTGRSLLAHELTHVIQQTSAGGPSVASEEAAEHEAHANSQHVAAGRSGRVHAHAGGAVLQRDNGASGSATFGRTTEEKKDETKTATEGTFELKVPVLPNGKLGKISLVKDADLKLKLAEKQTTLKPGESEFESQLSIGLALAQLELFKHDLGSSGRFGSLSSDLKLGGSAEGSASSTGTEKGALGSKLDFNALKYTLPKLEGGYGTLGGNLTLSGSAKTTLPSEGDATAGVGAKLGGGLDYTSPKLPYHPYGPLSPLRYGQVKLGATGSLSADYDNTGKTKLGAGVGFSAGYEWMKLGGVQPFVTVKVDLKWTQADGKVEPSQVSVINLGLKF